MAQRLQIGPAKFVVVDRTFGGGEVRARRIAGPGGIVQLGEDIPAAPFIAMKDGGFYYMTAGFEPVTKKDDVAHLPHTDPKTGAIQPGSYRAQAEKWIDANAAKAKPLKVVSEKAAAAELHRRGGRKKAARKPVVIKDERSLARAAGGVTVQPD